MGSRYEEWVQLYSVRYYNSEHIFFTYYMMANAELFMNKDEY